MAVADELSRYRYISTLGSGGMARVDLAQDTLLERRVALKRMSETTDPRGISRLRREAMTGASLSHPNLVSIYDVITCDDGRLVLVMEYVAGETLRARINRDGKLPVDDALRILDGVAAGLDAIHARGIIHRDVKPSNILLGDDGVVKVADLGIASVPDGTRITTSGSIIGSLSYMAPEQLTDTRASPAIDIYALAAVAFEMLSGRKARREPNAVALAHALATHPPPDLRSAWPDAPAAAAELLSRGMSRDPKTRPRSAGELVGRLKAALAPEPTAAMAAPKPMRAPLAAVAAPPPAPRQLAPRRAPTTPANGRRSPRPRPPSPAPVPAAGPDRRRRTRSGAVAASLLGLVAVAVVLAVVLNAGGGQDPRTAPTGTSRHRSPATSRHPTTNSATRAASTPAAPASSGSSRSASASSGSTRGAQASSSSTLGASASSGSGPGATASSASGPDATASSAHTPAGSSTSGGGAPTSAVESFYELAASHRYEEAWALADSTMRAQLRGYSSFQAGQAGTRSITFNGARTVSQSAGSASVAIQTTSVRDDGTHHCTGSVDLVPGGSSGGWLLHQIHIVCTP